MREPNPAAPTNPAQDLWTYYTYDVLNHLTGVSMTRGSVTQTRTFNYIDPVAGKPSVFLRSATNPENGTVSYTYNADGTLASKTDAKSQVFSYGYDSYKRVVTVSVGGVLGCGRSSTTRIHWMGVTHPIRWDAWRRCSTRRMDSTSSSWRCTAMGQAER